MAARTIVQQRRSTELTLIVMAGAIIGVAYALASLGANSVIPARMGLFLALVLVRVEGILWALAMIGLGGISRWIEGRAALRPLALHAVLQRPRRRAPVPR